jgi:hypothetical protein
MEPLGSDLIPYQELLTFLKEKGKSKNWFDTLRTRHKLIHEPIIKPPQMLSFKEKDATGRKGRSVFYLREIKPYLEEIIRLHDQEDFTYKQIEDKSRDRLGKLNRLRELQLIDDKCLKPSEFFYDFAVAKAKLKEYFGWKHYSEETQFLDHIDGRREEYGRQYYTLTEEIKASSRESHPVKDDKLMEQRRKLGKKISFCHRMMEPIIQLCMELLKDKKITLNAEETEKIRGEVDKRMG